MRFFYLYDTELPGPTDILCVSSHRLEGSVLRLNPRPRHRPPEDRPQGVNFSLPRLFQLWVRSAPSWVSPCLQRSAAQTTSRGSTMLKVRRSRSPPPRIGGHMKRVTGIGGIFFKAKDAPSLQAWYKRHLGIDVQAWGGCIFRCGSWDESNVRFIPTNRKFRDSTEYFSRQGACSKLAT
jgi:hypothetical protein